MNRRYTKEQYLELAAKIRREIPDISLTTDIMVGFPGETAEDVDDTIDVIRKMCIRDRHQPFRFLQNSGYCTQNQNKGSRSGKKRAALFSTGCPAQKNVCLLYTSRCV